MLSVWRKCWCCQCGMCVEEVLVLSVWNVCGGSVGVVSVEEVELVSGHQLARLYLEAPLVQLPVVISGWQMKDTHWQNTSQQTPSSPRC